LNWSTVKKGFTPRDHLPPEQKVAGSNQPSAPNQ
jgi:hypothetical protein